MVMMEQVKERGKPDVGGRWGHLGPLARPLAMADRFAKRDANGEEAMQLDQRAANTRRLAKRGVSLCAEEEGRRAGRKQGRDAADGLVWAACRVLGPWV